MLTVQHTKTSSAVSVSSFYSRRVNKCLVKPASVSACSQ